MDIQVLRELFEANLNPIREDIKELKDGQLQLIEIARIQTRHEENISNIKKDVDKCSGNVEKWKETRDSRLWEVIKLGIAGTIGGVIGKFF